MNEETRQMFEIATLKNGIAGGIVLTMKATQNSVIKNSQQSATHMESRTLLTGAIASLLLVFLQHAAMQVWLMKDAGTSIA